MTNDVQRIRILGNATTRHILEICSEAIIMEVWKNGLTFVVNDAGVEQIIHETEYELI